MAIDYITFPSGNGADKLFDDSTPPAAASIASGEVATIAIWFRSAGTATFKFLTGTTAASGSGLGLRYADVVADRQQAFAHDGTSSAIDNATAAVSTGAWHHAAIVVNHTGSAQDGHAAQTMTIFVDGTAAASPTSISTLGTITAQQLAIGARSSTSGRWAGDVKIAEMYKDTATAAEISTAAGTEGASLGIASAVFVVAASAISDASLPSLPATYTDPQGNVWTIGSSVTGTAAPVAGGSTAKDMLMLGVG